MAEWLILRLPRASDGAASWLVSDGEGRALSPPQSGGLELAAAARAGRRLAVLVPAADVLHTQVDLPDNSVGRAAQLVPFALEEQLVSDIESQHFAIQAATRGSAGRTRVAVVARAHLDQWLSELRAAGLNPELLCTDAALLPALPSFAVALLEGEILTLRDTAGNLSTLSAPAGGFADALAVALGAHLGESALLFHATPLDWQRRSAEVEAIRPHVASLKVQLLTSGVLPWLAAQLHSAAPINLLQGSYAQRAAPGLHWQRWRVAAVLALALLVAHVADRSYRLWSLNRTERELDAAIAQVVGPALGGAAGAESASVRTRVERALLGAQAGGDRAGLLPAIQVLAQALGAAPGARLEALSFRDGALQLKLKASDAQSLERINQSLRSAGWQAELVSGVPAGDAYEGNIQLRGSIT